LPKQLESLTFLTTSWPGAEPTESDFRQPPLKPSAFPGARDITLDLMSNKLSGFQIEAPKLECLQVLLNSYMDTEDLCFSEESFLSRTLPQLQTLVLRANDKPISADLILRILSSISVRDLVLPCLVLRDMIVETDVGISVSSRGNGRVEFLRIENVTCSRIDEIMLTEPSRPEEIYEWWLLPFLLGRSDEYQIILTSGEEYRAYEY